MTPPFAFGLSQEDPRTDARALELARGDRVLCVASAGEMPLSLLAAGASRVVGVDAALAEIHLARLKLAAILTFDRDTALRFLGLLPASPRARRARFAELAAELAPDAQAFWAAHPRAIERGAVWAGRYERYVRLLGAIGVRALGRRRFERLFACATLAEQVEHFDREIGRPVVRALFRVAFHPKVFQTRGMDPRSLRFRATREPLGEQYYRQFRALCTGTLARENPYLQLTLLGELTSADAAPDCYTEAAARVLRARRDDLAFVCDDVTRHLLASPAGAYTKLQLSNLADWMSEAEFGELLRAADARLARPGRLVWRFLHVDRAVPPDLAGRIVVEPDRGRALVATDRFPFYAVMPAALPGGGGAA